VLTEGRISLRVMTESVRSVERQLDHARAGDYLTQVNSLTIPSIKTRRAETTLEIPSGGRWRWRA